MTTDLATLRKHVNHLLHRRQDALDRIDAAGETLTLAETSLADAEDGRKVLQAVAEECQKTIHANVAGVVSKALRGVFGEDVCSLDIDFRRSRGRTEALLSLVDGDLVLDDPIDEDGGGLIDVAGLTARIACLVLSRPPLRRLLVLDEPWRNLSPQYRPMVPKLITTLAEELNLQIVFATNFTEYQCGKVINLEEVGDGEPAG